MDKSLNLLIQLKIRFDPKLSSLDNLHYEKIGRETRCIEDEIPFEIPKNFGLTQNIPGLPLQIWSLMEKYTLQKIKLTALH